MSTLRHVFLGLGLPDAKAPVHGDNLNIFFNAKGWSEPKLESLLEFETEKRLRMLVSYFLRSSKELAHIMTANPFKREARSDPGNLRVYLLKMHPTPGNVAAVRHMNTGSEQVEVRGREAYVYFPDGVGRSKFELPWKGTARSWNTMVKLAELMPAK